MSGATVVAAYGGRAVEYAAALGTMASVHPCDRELVIGWARALTGRVLDVGCGPGHWTAHLAATGADVEGIDPTPAFVDHARRAHPGVAFRVADAEHLEVPRGSLGGVLAWYSLIHHRPDDIDGALASLADATAPGGGLLVGFFGGDAVGSAEPFDHAVVTAYRWPASALATRIAAAGYEVLETHTRTSRDDRPHAAILARRT